MAHVEKRVRRGNTTWRARYRSPDGAERSKSFNRRFDAEKFLARVEVDKSAGSWIDPERSKLRFGEWAERWMSTTSHLKPKTVSNYESLLRSRIQPTFGNAPIGAIRPIDVREWLASLQADGLSASRCRAAYHLLGSIFRTAVDDRRVATSPCVGIKLPRLPQLEMSYFRPDDLRDLLAAIDPQYRVFVQVLATGGLRFGEAAALRIGRCDLARSRLVVAESLADVSGTLYFGPPKTHQRRVVHLPRIVRDSLAAHLASTDGRESMLVFEAPRGGPIRYSNFLRRVWKPALIEAGLPDVGIHVLRHTCSHADRPRRTSEGDSEPPWPPVDHHDLGPLRPPFRGCARAPCRTSGRRLLRRLERSRERSVARRHSGTHNGHPGRPALGLGVEMNSCGRASVQTERVMSSLAAVASELPRPHRGPRQFRKGGQ